MLLLHFEESYCQCYYQIMVNTQSSFLIPQSHRNNTFVWKHDITQSNMLSAYSGNQSFPKALLYGMKSAAWNLGFRRKESHKSGNIHITDLLRGDNF